MELKCVLVLALVPIVTAYPHGYGVKGGAGTAAKAEAAAGASGFAGVPLAIPSGAGYSGSFEKSSSSSFAASSASSSASSFSFSGSGTQGAAANGLSGVGGNGVGTEGCNGSCKSGNNIIPDTSETGSNNQAYSGAKAAAGVGAVASSGNPNGANGYQAPCSSGDCSYQKTPDCRGSSCDDTTVDTEKCTSGKCQPIPQATATKEKCSSGQCSISASESAPSYDTDDIQVNIASESSKTLQKSNDQPDKYYKKPSDYEPSQLYPSTPNKPTTYLTTPKEDTPCTSPDCAPISSSPGGAYDKQKPSSYNVPILGPNYAPSTQNTVPCSTGNCKSNQPSSPQTTVPSGPSGSGSICTSGSCQQYPNNQINPGSPGVPSDFKPPSPTGGPTVIPSSGAKNPSYVRPIAPSNSAFVNTGAAASSNSIGNYRAVKPTTASTDKKLPPYTGGFGGPAGILKPNDFSTPNQVHVSSYKPVQSTTPTASAPCVSGNCAARPSRPEDNIPACSNGNCGSPQFPAFTSENPGMQPPSQSSTCSSGSCGVLPESKPIQQSPPLTFNPPSSTVNFDGPSGILKPNDYSIPSLKPTPTPSSYNPQNLPSVQHDQTNEPSSIQYKPIGSPVCASGNCAARPSKPEANIPACSHGNCGNPNTGIQPSQSSTCSSGSCSVLPGSKPIQQSPPLSFNPPLSTGNFGGPSGILKPNDYSKPSIKPTATSGSYNPTNVPSVQHDQTNEPSSIQYKPTGTPVCASGNCGSRAPSSDAYSPSGPSKPNTQISSVGFGGPAGILKPNDFNKPFYKPFPTEAESYNPPEFSQHNKPNTPQYESAESSAFRPCSSGNCGYQPPKPQFGSTVTAQTYPTLCESGKCESQPTQTSKVPAGPYNSAYCTSGNCGTNQIPPFPSTPTNPSSPGLNKPEISGSYHSTSYSSPSLPNYGTSHSPSQTHSTTGTAASGSYYPLCSSGKCTHEQPSPQYGSSDSKPEPSANTYNPQPCPAGNCGSPNKNPNISSTSIGAFSSATCSSGDCGNSVPGHSMPHYNQPGYTNIAVGAVASASAAAYTGGFGGPPGLLKPYDGGKLSSLPAGFGPQGPFGAAPYRPAGPSSYGKSLTGTDSSLSGAGAQASAAAGAAAGSYGGHLVGYNGQESGKGGCISGCGSQGGADFGHNGGLDGYGALSGAGASAKSVAGAFGGGGAGVYGQAGSFASSSASAHASAGAATKGGYGRR